MVSRVAGPVGLAACIETASGRGVSARVVRREVVGARFLWLEDESEAILYVRRAALSSALQKTEAKAVRKRSWYKLFHFINLL